MKTLFTILIFSILCSFSLHSQWLEKEGYWELSEKIPELRDLKILPEENLIITVSKDNTIRHIEYDSGKILKYGKPEGITEDNDYAKISSDGKTTVFGKFLKNPIYNYKILVTDNNDYSSVCSDTLSSKRYFTNVIGDGRLVSFNANCKFSDYDNQTQKFLCILNCNISYNSYSGQFYKYNYYGYKFNSEVVDGKFHNSDSSIYNNVVSYNKIGNLDTYNLAFVGMRKSVTSGGNSPTSSSESSKLIGVNVDEDKFDELLIYNEYSSEKYNYYKEIDQVFEGIKPNQLLYLVDQELYTFDLKSKKNIDSVKKQYFKNICGMSHHSIFMHTFENNKYSMFSYPYSNEKFSQSFPDKSILLSPNIDEINGIITLCFSDGSICKLRPKNISSDNVIGFYLSKDSVYENENFDVFAFSNGKNLKYQWEFFPGIIDKDNLSYKSYSYTKAGNYDIKLTITDSVGKTYIHIKRNAVTVIERPKALFEIKILNDTLPLKVQFTNKSAGNIKSWKWGFGDGEFSIEQNPIHEYKFAGDFSSNLIVSDGIDNDTLIKYESITYNIQVPVTTQIKKQKVMNTSAAIFRNSYLLNRGINLIWSYEYTETYIYGTADNYTVLNTNIWDFDLIKIDSYSKVHHVLIDKDRIDNTMWLNPNSLFYNIEFSSGLVFNYTNRILTNVNNAKIVLQNNDNAIFWIDNRQPNLKIIKTDSSFKKLSELIIKDSTLIQYLADTINNGLNLIIKEQNNSYYYGSISPENTIISEKSFSLDTNVTLSNIKSVHNNLILLYGFYKDAVNKTTYAYFGKYHPLDNYLQDTILYSRKDIRKLERVNNSTFAAIGQSRGRQGYLLLDTNLHQIKDIRVDSLTGEIKDMILHDNKVYLFTEKIVSLETMALGTNESYQTTASVLGLPEDIIASVKDSPIIITEKLTHSAYPNPANEVLNLKVMTNQATNYTIKLYDIFGTEILQIHDGFIPAQTEKIFSIPTSSLSIGSYYYVICGGGLVERGKVMVVR